MSGRNPPLHYINRHAGNVHQNRDKRHDEPGYSSILLHLGLGSKGYQHYHSINSIISVKAKERSYIMTGVAKCRLEGAK